MVWKPVERNFDKVQFEVLRKEVDPKFNQVHDELSDCFYNGKPFRTYGILTKEKFDKLHGLIFLMRDVEFHSANLRKPKKDQIPEEKYNWVDDTGAIKRSDLSSQAVQNLKLEGFELVI